ncbi:hypothetical protein OAP11_00530 [Bacteroidia bacterium]|nr:hypothetical protein [Bacteroidia bacterium]
MVLAPWAAGGDTTVSGLRMDKFGNIGIGTPTNNGFILQKPTEWEVSFMK